MTIVTVGKKQSKLPQDACEKGLMLIWNAMAKKECPDGSVTALPPVVCKDVENSGSYPAASGNQHQAVHPPPSGPQHKIIPDKTNPSITITEFDLRNLGAKCDIKFTPANWGYWWPTIV
eukprot:7938855-Karenia_brevis.AAC.1